MSSVLLGSLSILLKVRVRIRTLDHAFFSHLLFGTIRHLLFRLFKVPAECRDDAEQLMRLHLLFVFFAKVFAELGELSLGGLDYVS